MKKLLLLIIALLVFSTSCRKDECVEHSYKRGQVVQFRTDNFYTDVKIMNIYKCSPKLSVRGFVYDDGNGHYYQSDIEYNIIIDIKDVKGY